MLIDQVHVVLVVPDAIESGLKVRSHIEHRLKPRIGERHLDQALRLRVIVHDQDPDDLDLWECRRA